MAYFRCNFNSSSLMIACSMDVIIQQTPFKAGEKDNFNKKSPVLYLLHGLSDDHSMWQRRTSIERYADKYGFNVVMPEVNRSFYTNMKTGQRYWDFISEELPCLARQFFNLSDKREDNFVAGLSMGGYGAFKLALSNPERYAAAASLSGALDIVNRLKVETESSYGAELNNIFGGIEELKESNNDLFALADKAGKSDYKVKLFQCCGTEDFLYEDNINFRDYANNLKLDLTYEEGSGTHEWGFWDENIKKVLEWMTEMRA